MARSNEIRTQRKKKKKHIATKIKFTTTAMYKEATDLEMQILQKAKTLFSQMRKTRAHSRERWNEGWQW